MAKKKKKVVKKKPSRTKTKLVPSKIPGVDLDVIVKRKPAKKIIKKKKPKTTNHISETERKKHREVDTLPPYIVPLPPKPKRRIPKDITKSVMQKVPRRRQTPPPVPSRLRGRPALDTSMLLAPLGAGPAIRAAGRGVRALKKPRRAGPGAGAGAALGASAGGLGPLGAIGGALAGALSARPAMSGLRRAVAAKKAAKDKRGRAVKRKKSKKKRY